MSRFRNAVLETSKLSKQKSLKPKNVKQEILLQIPGCTANLIHQGEAFELAKGEFKIVQISDKNGVSVATVIKVGEDLQWPLTKDEPVVKLDFLHYLFSLPMKDGVTLSYGVTFSEYSTSLLTLDSLLRQHSCLTCSPATSNENLDWKQYAPRIEDYNNFLAKAIAGGTGQIVKGIFMCSNAYCNLVHNGGQMILTRVAEDRNGLTASEVNGTKKIGLNESLKRVKNLTKMMEDLSKATLEGVSVVTATVMAAGKALLSAVPGEVLLASLDAVNKILDAAEVAEKQAMAATSSTTARVVTDRFGESAGEAAVDVFATAGHCTNTAWNISKIRKTINPASLVSIGTLRNAAKEMK